MAQLRRGYKVRHYVSGTGKDGNEYKNYSLTVPSEIAEALPDQMQFLPRMIDEVLYDSNGEPVGALKGLLFEPVDHAHIEVPSWAKQNGKTEIESEAA